MRVKILNNARQIRECVAVDLGQPYTHSLNNHLLRLEMMAGEVYDVENISEKTPHGQFYRLRVPGHLGPLSVITDVCEVVEG